MRSDGSGVRQMTDDPAGANGPYFSPDGRRLVFVRSHHLWLLRIATGAERQLTFGRGSDSEPVFTPSGQRILFASNRDQRGGKHDSSDNVGSSSLMVMRPDGTHHRSFDVGIVETDGFGSHIGGPAWGSTQR